MFIKSPFHKPISYHSKNDHGVVDQSYHRHVELGPIRSAELMRCTMIRKDGQIFLAFSE